jgi:hypothetical protein
MAEAGRAETEDTIQLLGNNIGAAREWAGPGAYEA